MSPPLHALLAGGAKGLPPPEPVDFASLVLPRSPNACLAAPAGAHPGARITVPPLSVDAGAAWPALRRLGEQFPRTFRLGEWPERHQAQWVVRSALFRFPDIVTAELVPDPAGAGLFLYSRSLFGWSDLGVNRRRVAAWLATFELLLRLR